MPDIKLDCRRNISSYILTFDGNSLTHCYRVRGGSRGRAQGVRTPLPPEMTCGFLPKKKKMWFIGVEVERETSAPPSKKNPGSAPACVKVSLVLRGGIPR